MPPTTTVTPTLALAAQTGSSVFMGSTPMLPFGTAKSPLRVTAVLTAITATPLTWSGLCRV